MTQKEMFEPPKLSRQQGLILERLNRGPAQNIELREIAGDWRRRVSDLRQKGWKIEITKKESFGVNVYEIIEAPNWYKELRAQRRIAAGSAAHRMAVLNGAD